MQALMTREASLLARVIREPPSGMEACRKQMGTLHAEARALAPASGVDATR